jgi:hypothetical protein
MWCCEDDEARGYVSLPRNLRWLLGVRFVIVAGVSVIVGRKRISGKKVLLLSEQTIYGVESESDHVRADHARAFTVTAGVR